MQILSSEADLLILFVRNVMMVGGDCFNCSNLKDCHESRFDWRKTMLCPDWNKHLIINPFVRLKATRFFIIGQSCKKHRQFFVFFS